MKTKKEFIVHQEGAGDYPVTAFSEEQALKSMSKEIIDSYDGDRTSAFGSEKRSEQVEFVLKTLSIVTEVGEVSK